MLPADIALQKAIHFHIANGDAFKGLLFISLGIVIIIACEYHEIL